MTRTIKKAICIIVIGTLALAAFIFVLWGSHGGTEWDPAKWFDYWGKGAPKVVSTVPDTSEDLNEPEARVMTSVEAANVGPVYDSDDTIVSVDLQQLSMPECYGLMNNGSYGLWFADNNRSIPHKAIYTIHVGEGGNTLVSEGELEAQTTYIFDLYNDLGDKGGYGTMYFVNMQFISMSSSYSDSNTYRYRFYLPEKDVLFPDVDDVYTFTEDNTVRIKMPYSYKYAPSSMGSTSAYHTLRIKVGVCDEYGTFSEQEGYCVDNYDNNLINAVISYAGENFYEVDLLELPWLNELQPYCTIKVDFYYTYSYYGGVPVFAKYPQYAFSISRLASPVNIHQNGNYVEWDEVEGANGYVVFLSANANAEPHYVNEPRIEIIDSGLYTFRVRALGNMGKQLVESEASLAILTPYNASVNFTQLVVLNYSIDGDIVSKFVPVDSALGDYLYDVEVSGKEFGGWYYDSGFSRAVSASDALEGDTTIYARLSDVKVTDRPLSWWDQYKWYVLIPAIAVVAIAAVVVGVVYVKKHK